jgi:hypothetical protein
MPAHCFLVTEEVLKADGNLGHVRRGVLSEEDLGRLLKLLGEVEESDVLMVTVEMIIWSAKDTPS